MPPRGLSRGAKRRSGGSHASGEGERAALLQLAAQAPVSTGVMRSGQLAAVANVTDPHSRFLHPATAAWRAATSRSGPAPRGPDEPGLRDRVKAVIFAYEAGLNRRAVGAKPPPHDHATS